MFQKKRIKPYHIILLIIGFIIGFIIFKSTSGPSETQKEPTVKIGFMGPLTADLPEWGESAKNGALLAIEEINNEGGINGKKIELIIEDDQCNPKFSTTAATKLITVDKVLAIIGTVCSSAFLGAVPIAEENKVVLIGSAPSSPEITESGDYIFRLWPSDVYQAKVMAWHIKNKENIDRVAIIFTNSDYNIALKDAFKIEFEKLDGKILAEETYEQYSKDFRTQLIKIRERNPEAIYVIPYSEGGILLRQIGQMGYEGKVFASETIASEDILKDARNAAEGVVYATVKHDKENEVVKEFLGKYKQKYGNDPPVPPAAGNAYDSIKLIVEAIKKYDESSEAIKKYLYEVKDYQGAGGKLTMDKNGDPIKEFEIMIIRKGKFEKFEK